MSLSLPPTLLDNLSSLKKQTTTPIVKNIIKLWFEVKKPINEPNVSSQNSPIWGNQHFTPGRADAVFKNMGIKGIRKDSGLVADQFRQYDDICRYRYIDKKNIYNNQLINN